MVDEEKTWLIFNERPDEFQIMNEIQRAKIILKILNKTYPSIKVPLKSRNVFTLLISVLLSAQCTDVNVNNVTKNIYPKYHILSVKLLIMINVGCVEFFIYIPGFIQGAG